MNSVKRAKEIFQVEIDTLERIQRNIDTNFDQVISLLSSCQGKIIITGMGKSGHIGAKIAATMASLGTPAFYVHPGEAAHGDLGMISEKDILLAISNSGETEEVIQLIPSLKLMGVRIVVMTSNCKSTLVQNSDAAIILEIIKEACSLGVAPTSSTTAALVYGDAIAIILSEMKGFTKDNFGIYHPKGNLGKQILLKVSDIMHSGDENPILLKEANGKDALSVIGNKAFGLANIVDKNMKLVGIITSGDLVRLIENDYKVLDKNVQLFMNRYPITVNASMLAVEAVLEIKKTNKKLIVLPVIDEEGICVGTLSVNDLIREKLY